MRTLKIEALHILIDWYNYKNEMKVKNKNPMPLIPIIFIFYFWLCQR